MRLVPGNCVYSVKKSFLIFSFALQRQIYLFLAGICQKLIRLLLLKFWRNCFVFFDDGWLAGWSGGRVWLSLSSLEHTTEQTMMMMMGKGDLVLTFCSVEKTGLLLFLFRPRLDLLWTGFPHTLERRRKWLLSWCPLFLPAALEQKMRKIYFFCNRFDWPFVWTFCKQLFCLPLIHSVVLKHWHNVFFWPIFWRNGPFQTMFWLYFLIFKASFQQKKIARFKPWPASATLPQSRSKMTKHIAPNQTVWLFFTANSVSVKRMTQLRACFCLNWQNRLLVLFSVLNSNHSFSFPTHGSTNYYQLLQISKLQQKVVLCDQQKWWKLFSILRADPVPGLSGFCE